MTSTLYSGKKFSIIRIQVQFSLLQTDHKYSIFIYWRRIAGWVRTRCLAGNNHMQLFGSSQSLVWLRELSTFLFHINMWKGWESTIRIRIARFSASKTITPCLALKHFFRFESGNTVVNIHCAAVKSKWVISFQINNILFDDKARGLNKYITYSRNSFSWLSLEI